MWPAVMEWTVRYAEKAIIAGESALSLAPASIEFLRVAPETVMIRPPIQPAAGEHRNSPALAMSCGSPRRWIGVPFSVRASFSG